MTTAPTTLQPTTPTEPAPVEPPRRGTVSRRAVVAGAAWATPAIIAATAAPARAASAPPCAPIQLVTDWTSASYARTSASTATYTWIDPLGNGSVPVLTLTIASTVVGPTFTSLAAANLAGSAGPTGGQSLPGLDLSLNLLQHTTATTNTGADYTFTFSQAVTNVAFTVTDIDGIYFGGVNTNSGAERVTLSSPSPISGTVTSSGYLTGTGVTGDPWRRRPSSTPNLSDLAKSSSNGNVSVTSAALTQFTLGFRLLDSTSNVALGSYNLWLTPITFTLLCP